MNEKKYASVLTAEEITKKLMEGMKKDSEEQKKVFKNFDVSGGQYSLDTKDMYEDK